MNCEKGLEKRIFRRASGNAKGQGCYVRKLLLERGREKLATTLKGAFPGKLLNLGGGVESIVRRGGKDVLRQRRRREGSDGRKGRGTKGPKRTAFEEHAEGEGKRTTA